MLCQEEMERARRDRDREPAVVWAAAVARAEVWAAAAGAEQAAADAWVAEPRGRAGVVCVPIAEPRPRTSRVFRALPRNARSAGLL